MDFLFLLRDALRDGLRNTPEVYRDRHAAWLSAQEHPDGGFKNRRGNAELYYTTFGVRSLSALERLTPDVAQRTAGFLMRLQEGKGGACRDAVASVSWWDAMVLCEEVHAPLPMPQREDLKAQTHAHLNALRRDDGGWAKTAMEGNGSLYHSFLAACAYARMGRELPEAVRVEGFLKSLAQPGGGFLENKFSKRPGANGTAAGVALSLLLRARGAAGRFARWTGLAESLLPLAAKDLAPHAECIHALRSPEGGFYAMPAAPIADLLSTFTSLFTLRTLNRLDDASLQRALAYARSQEQEEGGYVGFALETKADCEYTFYGLGVEALAAGQ